MSWEPLLERARLLDRCGVDRLVVSEHVAFGERLDQYSRPELGGAEGGRQPTGPDGDWLDPIVALSHVSALTTRIRLSTGVLLAALRRPVGLAKEAATLDVLSGGRFDLGVGVGWQREEYEAAGLDFEARGRLLDHNLDVCRELWSKRASSHHCDELHFDRIHQMPKPISPGGVPIWVSGTLNPAVVRRVVRFGTGWIPWGPAAADFEESVTQMFDAVDAAGGDPARLEVVANLGPVRRRDRSIDVPATVEASEPLIAVGATDLRASFVPDDPSAAEDLLTDLVATFAELA